jgi:hypothetical protein
VLRSRFRPSTYESKYMASCLEEKMWKENNSITCILSQDVAEEKLRKTIKTSSSGQLVSRPKCEFRTANFSATFGAQCYQYHCTHTKDTYNARASFKKQNYQTSQPIIKPSQPIIKPINFLVTKP